MNFKQAGEIQYNLKISGYPTTIELGSDNGGGYIELTHRKGKIRLRDDGTARLSFGIGEPFQYMKADEIDAVGEEILFRIMSAD